MKFIWKYIIVTGITDYYKINPENPKYFAKYINDNIMCFGNTKSEAIENLKKIYLKYKRKNKLCSFFSNRVLNSFVSTEKAEKYLSISINFFELIGEDPYIQIDDEFTVKDFELSEKQISLINLTYGLNIQNDDFFVNIFEKIHQSSA